MLLLRVYSICVTGDKNDHLLLWRELQKQGQTEYLSLRSFDYGVASFFLITPAESQMTLGDYKVIKLLLFHL